MAYGAMTQRELIELVQQHHPKMGETECRKAINRAQSQFCSETDIIEDTFTDTVIEGQRYYKLAQSNALGNHPILDIKRVDIEGEVIPRLIGPPPTVDVDPVT
tara:strand:+ start:2453 stop:2761 length:309 start_codon:yes stop_codon:yes gene_type:complete